jgi:hypothetical protein
MRNNLVGRLVTWETDPPQKPLVNAATVSYGSCAGAFATNIRLLKMVYQTGKAGCEDVGR